MRKLFTLNDTTKSGFVETNRLAGILATIGQVFDEEELDDIIEGVDVEGKQHNNLESSLYYNVYKIITTHRLWLYFSLWYRTNILVYNFTPQNNTSLIFNFESAVKLYAEKSVSIYKNLNLRALV